VHHSKTDRHRLQLSGEGEDRVSFAGGVRRAGEPGRVIGKAERIGGANLRLRLLGSSFIEQDVRVLRRADAAVMATVRTDIEVPLEFLADVGVAADLALLPRIGGNLVLLPARESGLLFLLEPGHAGN